eukprot:8591882-Lingulodinium_polyedra.AAC.1
MAQGPRPAGHWTRGSGPPAASGPRPQPWRPAFAPLTLQRLGRLLLSVWRRSSRAATTGASSRMSSRVAASRSS